MSLSERVRAGSESAPWVVEKIEELEKQLESKNADIKLLLDTIEKAYMYWEGCNCHDRVKHHNLGVDLRKAMKEVTLEKDSDVNKASDNWGIKYSISGDTGINGNGHANKTDSNNGSFVRFDDASKVISDRDAEIKVLQDAIVNQKKKLHRWYRVKCPECGWRGSSEYFKATLPDEYMCPNCYTECEEDVPMTVPATNGEGK